jgi:PAS domain-containing protein
MVEGPGKTFRSGDALFAFDADLTIVSWNRAAEELTAVSANEAVGRSCWEVLGGRDERGNVVCHPGCDRVTRALLEPAGVRLVAVEDYFPRLLDFALLPPGASGASPTRAAHWTPRQTSIIPRPHHRRQRPKPEHDSRPSTVKSASP